MGLWTATLAKRKIRTKFNLLLAVQMLVLAAISLGAWLTLDFAVTQMNLEHQAVEKAKLLSNTLNANNIIRSVHISMIAAAKDEAYQAKRGERLKEMQLKADEFMRKLEALPWDPEERPLVAQGLAATRKYNAAFPAVLDQARASKGPLDPAAMEVNVKDQRAGREGIEKALEIVNQHALAFAKATTDLAAQIKRALVAGGILAVLAGIFLTALVGRQVEGSAKDLLETLRLMGKGDLTRMPTVEGRDEFAEIAQGLSALSRGLRQDLSAIAGIAERTASGATELAATTEQLESTTLDISRGAETQRQAMASSESALSAVATSISEVRTAVAAAGRYSEESLAMSAKGLACAQGSSVTMQAIEDSSTKVGRITTVIADIARQTNLLSLNAAIEAAKAGHQGKGFAVVAEEIRKLAERSGAAAKEIAQLIQDSAEKVREGSVSTEAVREILAAIEDNTHARSRGAVVIGHAVEEQTNSCQVVVGAIGTTTQLSERNASATTELASTIQETARTVADLAKQAGELHQLTRKFKLG